MTGPRPLGDLTLFPFSPLPSSLISGRWPGDVGAEDGSMEGNGDTDVTINNMGGACRLFIYYIYVCVCVCALAP